MVSSDSDLDLLGRLIDRAGFCALVDSGIGALVPQQFPQRAAEVDLPQGESVITRLSGANPIDGGRVAYAFWGLEAAANDPIS
jgi:hypothetical protein